MRRGNGVAHKEALSAAELSVNVDVWFNAVLDQRADKSIDTVARAALSVRALGDAGNETREIDEEAHVRKAFGYDTDVAALAVLVGLLAERQSLMNADHLNA